MTVLVVTLVMFALLLVHLHEELKAREAEAAEDLRAECQRLLETLQSQHAIQQDTINIQHDLLHQQRLRLEGKGSADT